VPDQIAVTTPHLHGGFELTPPYTIRGGVVQQAGKRRALRKHYL
jgi:hypothetical protein